MKPFRIAHIVNPLTPPSNSDLHVAQPITLESMIIARDFASSKVEVELLSTQFEEDTKVIPKEFTQTPNLERSVLNLGDFEKSKKLPLIKDILDRAVEISDAEYLIYTNIDITLVPHFYQAVASFIEKGHDAFMINRRRIPATYSTKEELPLIWSEIGKPHPGFDCFVFSRELYPKFELGNICIGVPFIEATIAHNLYAFAVNFKLFDELHLTTHIGMRVMNRYDDYYYWHNRNEFNEILGKIKPHLKAGALPYSKEGFIKRTIKRGLNPSVFTKLALELETKGFSDKAKYLLNEIRFTLLGPKR